jgi:VIT1/CCC1 family predicted Fe2+/Mn2+ transporter
MLWFLGALLIVFWVIGLAFKVTTGLIHVALVAGLILFILGFFRGRHTTVNP